MTASMNGLNYSPTTGYALNQTNPLSNFQAFQNYMPQSMPSAGNYDMPAADYSMFGNNQATQIGGLNTNALTPGTGNYALTNPNFGGGVGGASGSGGGFFDKMIGTKEMPGWGGLALNAATGLASTYLGLKQYGLAQDMFSENKRQYAQNFGAQANLTNARLEDRQTRRNIERPDSMAAADYMSKYGVKA